MSESEEYWQERLQEAENAYEMERERLEARITRLEDELAVSKRRQSPSPDLCPPRIVASFIAYRALGAPPGDFVRACLENKLVEALKRADQENREALPHIAAWLYWEMPAGIWGSPEAVGAHIIAKRRAEQPV